MANHCIDAECLACGGQWCLRGCGWKLEPPKDFQPNTEDEKKVLALDDQCPHCGCKKFKLA